MAQRLQRLKNEVQNLPSASTVTGARLQFASPNLNEGNQEENVFLEDDYEHVM